MTAPDPVPLPDGTRLVHIGPHKTGTSTLQGAFHVARRAAAAQGVHYAGPNRQPLRAAQAIAAIRGRADSHAPALRPWRALAREVLAARERRVVVSSEWFADAEPDGIRFLANALDPERVNVVVTLRPLGRILASQWQQLVQAGTTMPYDRWLRAVFDEPSSGAAKRFWHRHRHDELIERWAAVVGRDRVTAVVVDDRDHAAVLRVFERLAGLAEGTLELVPDRANRSLTRPEAELIRAMNGSFAEAGVEGQLRLELVLFGAAANLRLRAPGPDEPRIDTPAWALQRAAPVAREIADGISTSGVRVVGDLDRLAGDAPESVVEKSAPPAAASRAAIDESWSEVAATGAIGVLTAAGLARSGERLDAIEPYSSQRVRSIVLGRLRDAIEHAGIAAP